MGLFKPGSNAELDQALERMPQLTGFLRQGLTEASLPAQTIERLHGAMRASGGGQP